MLKRFILECLIGCLVLLRSQVFIFAEDYYQSFSLVDEVVQKFTTYQPSGLMDYTQVIDQQFSLDSLLDLFNPYYYYSINTNSIESSETTRIKVVSSYCDPYYYEVVMTKSDGTVYCKKKFYTYEI